MKLRLFFVPSVAVLLLGFCAALLWWGTLATWPTVGPVVLLVALFYSMLFVLSAWALWRMHAIERWMVWTSPRRLLVLAPHEDDCVISAGGLGLLNRRLGGALRILYLASDETPGLAGVREREARAAWREAGLDEPALKTLDLLPPLTRRDPQRLRAAAAALRSEIDDFGPDTIIMPMFEGGHIHHDMVASMIGQIVTPQDRFEIFEAPEYSPFVSLLYTPHRLVALCTRWLFGLVSYYGPPDGIDGRTVFKLRLSGEELAVKRRMLGAFVSQNASSLAATRAYPDRLVRWERGRQKQRPFDPDTAYAWFARLLHRLVPQRLAERVMPLPRGTIGRGDQVTVWPEEWDG